MITSIRLVFPTSATTDHDLYARARTCTIRMYCPGYTSDVLVLIRVLPRGASAVMLELNCQLLAYFSPLGAGQGQQGIHGVCHRITGVGLKAPTKVQGGQGPPGGLASTAVPQAAEAGASRCDVVM